MRYKNNHRLIKKYILEYENRLWIPITVISIPTRDTDSILAFMLLTPDGAVTLDIAIVATISNLSVYPPLDVIRHSSCECSIAFCAALPPPYPRNRIPDPCVESTTRIESRYSRPFLS